jgi:hypothetical protein
MYACIPEIERGFFEGVCPPSNATVIFHDPPPPHNTKEPEPRQWDSGLKRITSRATVSVDLAWGRGKPSLPTARAPLTSHPRTALHVVDTSLEASRPGALLVGTRSLRSHDHAIRPLTLWSRRALSFCCSPSANSVHSPTTTELLRTTELASVPDLRALKMLRHAAQGA